MTIAGPRVLAVIGEDFRAFSWFARTNATGLPVLAIVFQCALALLFIFVSSFEEIIRLAGFTLGLNSFLTVLGVFVLRVRQPDLPRPYRTAWFPVPPLIYLFITGWTLVYLVLSDPTEAMVAFGIVFAGLIFYFSSRRIGGDQASADGSS
jgi:APA family basic amino acid/polyamine antiporter